MDFRTDYGSDPFDSFIGSFASFPLLSIPMLIDYKTSGYPHMFQLQWRANFPTEDEGLYKHVEKIIINIFENQESPKRQRKA